MWVEVDCDWNLTHPTILGMQMPGHPDKVVAAFNEKFHNKAYISKTRCLSRSLPELETDYLLISKVWEEEDPSENLSPFETTEEGETYLLAFKRMCEDY